MAALVKKLNLIYDYIKTKNLCVTHITVPPKEILVRRHVKGLGFTVTKEGHKDSEVDMRIKFDDHRYILTSAHYAL